MAAEGAYPVRVEASLDSPLTRGLVLVKWWLLAIPHYIIVVLFTGGAFALGWFGYRDGHNLPFTNLGLIGILAVIAGVILLFTGTYPRQLYDFVLGMNRWVLRVAAYAALMTDRYPPFHLDMGGHEPDGTLTLPPHQPLLDPGPGADPPGPSPQHGSGPEGLPRAPGWTTGRIVSLVIGAVLALCSLGVLAAGGVAVWTDATQRHGGYVHLGTASYTTAGHALASDAIKVHDGLGWLAPLIGKIRIRVTETGQSGGTFAGIAATSAANNYLSGVSYTTVSSYDVRRLSINHPGSRAPQPPQSMPIWAAQATGAPSATLLWTVRDGDWTIIVMNADGAAGVNVRADVAASLPALGWLATEFLVGGTVLALIAFTCILVPVRLATISQAGAGTADSGH